MRIKRLFCLLMIVLCSTLIACYPTEAQISSLSTQIAGEIYATQTADAKSPSTITVTDEQIEIITPTSTSTPTQIPEILEAFPVEPVVGLPEGTDGYPWWNDTVYYEIYVRSFYDSDGDGIGDLNGIIEKLDYLNDGNPETTDDLGVSGIWLMPIFASPTEHGYNVTDFYQVNPDYGTLSDLSDLLEAAHERGIRVILDISLNVTSNQHPWFIQGANPSSPYHDWYIWSNVDPGYTGSWGQQVWFPYNGRYFYSTFSAYSPDLNLENPEVKEELFNVARYWLEDVGVDGFRLDSAKHLIEEGTIQANSQSTHQWWKDFYKFYKQFDPQAMTVGEVWEDTLITATYLQGDEFDVSFEFWLAGAMIASVNDGNASRMNAQALQSYSEIPEMRFGTFLTNHDQERVMTQLFDDDQKAKLAASLLLTAPGIPFLYYGEELGLQGEWLNNVNRRPMQWSDGTFSGFSTTTPWQPLGPGWEDYNVALESPSSDSILSHYRTLIQIRNQHAALRVGDFTILTATDETIYSFIRVSANEAVLVLINLGDQPVENVWLTKSDSSLGEGTYAMVPILGEGDFAPLEINQQGGLFQLISTAIIPPYATLIFQLQKISP
jgi:glycosidase